MSICIKIRKFALDLEPISYMLSGTFRSVSLIFHLLICLPIWAVGPKFVVVSDLGAFGDGDQKKVAEAVGEAAYEVAPNAIINLGDTFHFWGVQSTDDPGWYSNFENIYTAASLHNLWYCVLGNHDYQGNTQALIDYTDKSRRWNLPARYYTKKFSRGGITVEFIFIDTTPLLQRALTQPEIYPDASLQDTDAMKEWLEQALADADADWVVVAAHHPVYSSRPDSAGQRADVSAYLEGVLAQHRPDFYLAGDVHCFEHTQRPGDTTDYVTCTSGSQAYPVEAGENVVFADGNSGYMTFVFDKSEAIFTMHDSNGNILYEYTKAK